MPTHVDLLAASNVGFNAFHVLRCYAVVLTTSNFVAIDCSHPCFQYVCRSNIFMQAVFCHIYLLIIRRLFVMIAHFSF